MATKEVIYNLIIKGTETQVKSLSKIEAQLKAVTETRNKLIAQEKKYQQLIANEAVIVKKNGQEYFNTKRKELKLTEDQVKKLSQLTQQQKVLQDTKKGLNQEIKHTINLNKSEANTLDKVNAELAEAKRKIKGVVIGSKEFKKAAANIKRLEDAQRRANKEMGRGGTFVGEYAKGAIDAFKKIGIAVAGAMVVVRSLSRLFTSSLDAYKKQEVAEKALTAAIKNRGETTKLTTEELKKQAAAWQELGSVGDEDILKGITTQLLTFTNITDDNFKKAQQAVLDIATTLSETGEPAFTELKSVSLQLGKALNDPIGQLGALSRSGIMFTEQQKEQIKVLAKTNRLNEAQAILLAAVNEQYGGQYETTAKGIGILKQTSNIISDLKEDFGKLILKGIFPFVSGIQKAAKALRNFTKESPVKEIQSQQKEMNILAVRLRDVNLPTDERNELIKRMNAISPALIKGLEDEDKFYENLTINVDEFNKKVVKRIQLAGIDKEQAQLLNQLAKKRSEIESTRETLATSLLENAKDIAGLEKLSLIEKVKLYEEELRLQKGTTKEVFRQKVGIDGQVTKISTTHEMLDDMVGFREALERRIEEEKALQEDVNKIVAKRGDLEVILSENTEKSGKKAELTAKQLKDFYASISLGIVSVGTQARLLTEKELIKLKTAREKAAKDYTTLTESTNKDILKLEKDLIDFTIAAEKDGLAKKLLTEQARHDIFLLNLNREKALLIAKTKLTEEEQQKLALINQVIEEEQLKHINNLDLILEIDTDNTKKSFDEQVSIEQEAHKRRLEAAGLYGKQSESLTKKQYEQLAKINKDHAENLIDINEDDLANKMQAFELAFEQERTLRLQAYAEDINAKDLTEKEKKDIADKYRDAELLAEKQKIQDTINLLHERLVPSIAGLDVSIAENIMSEEDQSTLKKQIEELKQQLIELGITKDDIGQNDEGVQTDILGLSAEDWEKFNEDTIQKALIVAGELNNIMGDMFAARNAAGRAELAETKSINEQKKKDLKDRLDSDAISEEQYNKQVQALDEETTKKRNEIAQKEDKRNKTRASFNVIISTAQAIIGAWADPLLPVWAKIAASILAGSTGAAQLVAINKAEMPTYAKGGQVKGSGTDTSDNIPIFASPNEFIVNAAAMKSKNQLTMSGTPFDIISAINAHGYASGGQITAPSIQSDMSFEIIESIVQETVQGIAMIPVVNDVNKGMEAQRTVQIMETEGVL